MYIFTSLIKSNSTEFLSTFTNRKVKTLLWKFQSKSHKGIKVFPPHLAKWSLSFLFKFAHFLYEWAAIKWMGRNSFWFLMAHHILCKIFWLNFCGIVENCIYVVPSYFWKEENSFNKKFDSLWIYVFQWCIYNSPTEYKVESILNFFFIAKGKYWKMLT